MLQSDILRAYGNASAAVARLEERLELSPVGRPLSMRLRFLEQEALAWAEGGLLDLDDMILRFGHRTRSFRQWPHLFAHAFGRPYPAGRPPSTGALLDWLGVGHDAGLMDDDPIWTKFERRPRALVAEKTELWARRASSAYRLPRLIAGADLAHAWQAVAPLARGNAVAALMIGDRWSLGRTRLSSGGIVAIGLRANDKHWRLVLGRNEEDDAAEPPRLVWLNAIVAAVQEALELERRLRLFHQRLQRHLEQRRATSRLPALIDLALESPAITLPYAVEKLRISKQAANILIEQACKNFLLRETTGGNSYRRYVATI